MMMQSGIPELLVELLMAQYGAETVERIMAGYAAVRPVTLRINTIKTNRDAVTDALDQAGISWQGVPWYQDALVLTEAREDTVRALPLYDRGEIYLQGLTAMLPPLVLAPRKGETILDMAAAPGGKTTQMAALSGNEALITACEKNKIRAERLQFNIDRQGAKHTMVMQADARTLDDLFSFDKILLDAPCSGSGTVLLREGEAPRRMTRDWLNKTASTQAALLQKALRLLKPGHEMVYATCSVLRQENEEVLQKVLPRCGGEILPMEHDMTGYLPLLPTAIPGTLCICPDRLHEGFFVARIRRKKAK